MCPKTTKQRWHETCILPSELSKLLIPGHALCTHRNNNLYNSDNSNSVDRTPSSLISGWGTKSPQAVCRNQKFWASQLAQWQRIRLTMQETQEMQVRSLGWEDLLEKEMATHSSILAWEMPWTEEPGGLWSIGSQRVRHD